MCSIVKTEIYCIDTVIGMQFQTFMSFVITDTKWSKRLELLVFEFILLQVEWIVFIERSLYSHIDLADVLFRDGIHWGVFVHAVDTDFFRIFNFLEVLVLLIDIIIDKCWGGDDKYSVFDVFSEVQGHKWHKISYFWILFYTLDHFFFYNYIPLVV